MMSPSQPMTVLHIAGSSENEFYFECSLLYSKAACRFPGIKALYGILRPSDQKWFFFQDDISHLEKNDLLSSKDGMHLSEFLKLISKKNVNLVVPHMFDQSGMTSFRAFFQNVLGLPVVGPDSFANTVAQNKVFTRGVLTAMGVPMPKGFAVQRPDPNSNKVDEDWVESTDYKSLGFPLIMKPPLEDNSRGISLVKNREQLKAAFEECFYYGQQALLEEFIPGREFRCGCIDLPHSINEYSNGSGKSSTGGGYSHASVPQPGGLQAIPAMIEYVMVNKDMPIRTAADKLTTDDKGAMCQVKCERRMPAEVDDDLKQKMQQITMNAHRALQCRAYSLFDFRVHAETGQPYIIECCAFWSFSPISAISLMLKASDLDYEKIIVDIWRMNAKENTSLCITDDAESETTGEYGSSGSTVTLSRSNSVSELDIESDGSAKIDGCAKEYEEQRGTSSDAEKASWTIQSLANAALLLDIDGTLVLTDDIYFAVFTDLLAPYGYEVDQPFYIKNVHGKVDADVFKALMPSDYGPEELKAVSQKKDQLFCAKAKELGVPIIPGLGEALAMAKQHGIRCIAVTNAPRPAGELCVEEIKKQFAAGDIIEDLVIGAECTRAKPFPDPYLEGMKRLGMGPEACVVFEDSRSGIAAGNAAGAAAVVGIQSSLDDKKLRALGAKATMADWKELTPQMLVELLNSTPSDCN